MAPRDRMLVKILGNVSSSAYNLFLYWSAITRLVPIVFSKIRSFLACFTYNLENYVIYLEFDGIQPQGMCIPVTM